MKKIWNYKIIDRDKTKSLANELNIGELLASVLVSRGLESKDDIKEFLNVDVCFNDPFLLNDMDKAVDRINEAIDNKEHITIYGDYDADGITSTANLILFLRSQGAYVDYYIPDRIKEGYGLSTEAVERILERGTDLIITVDCGISAVEEAMMVYELGCDMIITDHHECPDELPVANAIINPKRHDSNYPFKELAGVGVTYKLIEALCQRRGLGKEYEKYLALTAIGTISDIVPLVGENRAIVAKGLDAINNTSIIGLKHLVNKAGIKDINSTSIAFGISPRINAGGRMGNADLALKLFLTENENEALELAQLLNENNRNRQALEQEATEKVLEEISKSSDINDKRVIVVALENLHSGIIGIVASRVLEKYYKPVIILSIETDENGGMVAKGSARSIEGFNIYEMLSRVSEYLEKYGGHELAAGLTIKANNIEAFERQINEIAREIVDESVFVPRLNADLCIAPDTITVNNIEELCALEPYGQNNPSPSFIVCGFRLSTYRWVGSDGKHLKMVFEDGEREFDTIFFNAINVNLSLNLNNYYDIMFTLDINEWNNIRKPTIKIIDIRETNFEALFCKLDNIINYGRQLILENDSSALEVLKGRICNEIDRDDKLRLMQCLIDRDDMVVVYKYLRTIRSASIDNIAKCTCLNIYKVKILIDTLIELELVGIDGDEYFLREYTGKKLDLYSSSIFKVMSVIKEVI